jgi:hypothetical protein
MIFRMPDDQCVIAKLLVIDNSHYGVTGADAPTVG